MEKEDWRNLRLNKSERLRDTGSRPIMHILSNILTYYRPKEKPFGERSRFSVETLNSASAVPRRRS